jgi:hypothetical protein
MNHTDAKLMRVFAVHDTRFWPEIQAIPNNAHNRR